MAFHRILFKSPIGSPRNSDVAEPDFFYDLNLAVAVGLNVQVSCVFVDNLLEITPRYMR